MESLCDLLFELSNEDRLEILLSLKHEPTNVTNLANRLDLTTQEASRHVSRLNDVGLTRKESDGIYRLTVYGETVLRQLGGLEFSSRHQGYFTSHSITNLPQEFIDRLSDLTDSSYINDMAAALFYVEKVVQESEEYIWNITDRVASPSILPKLRDALDRKVHVRTIMALSARVVLPSTTGMLDSERSQETVAVLNEARAGGLLLERVLAGSKIYMCMSEKEVAGVAFPLQDGTFDYLGFTTKDEKAQKWCEDLFQYYWERAEPRSEVVERLHGWVKDQPKAISTLMSIATGEELAHGEEQVSKLEENGLVRQGELTLLGLLVYRRLQ